MTRVVIVGAGLGGLAAAAVLARAGLDVTVLEAHSSPGGCAATFAHGGYRFDAGATMPLGFYSGGPMDVLARETGISRWGERSADPALVVHLPDGTQIPRVAGPGRWDVRREVFGATGEAFWRWQERVSDQFWELAMGELPWPPQTVPDLLRLLDRGAAWVTRELRRRLNPSWVLEAFRPLGAHLRGCPEKLHLFVDAQLLISAQTTSSLATALYGACALDLPRRGAVHLEGGMGRLSEILAERVQSAGGTVSYRQEVTGVILEAGRPRAVETGDGETHPADVVVLNLPPGNAAALLGSPPPRLRGVPPHPKDGWGAFMVYAGIDGNLAPADLPLHHQVVVREPLSEGNSLFLSLSPCWDPSRAPAGRRAVTISSHVSLSRWGDLRAADRQEYVKQKEDFAFKLLGAAEVAVPGLSEAAEPLLTATPATFERYTRRKGGWVGGFPQTSLFRFWGPRLGPGLWLVGDSIFPGQSTAATALGGLRVARAVLESSGGRRFGAAISPRSRCPGTRPR